MAGRDFVAEANSLNSRNNRLSPVDSNDSVYGSNVWYCLVIVKAGVVGDEQVLRHSGNLLQINVRGIRTADCSPWCRGCCVLKGIEDVHSEGGSCFELFACKQEPLP